MIGLRHGVEFGAYLAFRTLVRLLPHSAARPLGGALGDLAWHLDRRHRRIALSNLEIALPELSADDRYRVARRCFRHIGGVACDTVSLGRIDAVRLCDLLTLQGWERAAAAESQGRGALYLTGHFGSWEVLPPVVGLFRGPLHMVARPMDNPLLDREMLRIRERFGNSVILKRGAARGMTAVLRQGGRVGILTDQRVRSAEGELVPFFGRPAVTSTLLARLSLRSGAPVVPIFSYPKPGGRYRVEVRPPIEPQGQGQEVALEMTRRYLSVFEDEIRRRPELWLWMHNRWKTI